ncbi:MAG: DUF2339 domain-containing protein, partial [Magnetococcales bacterium]|nr:DUF2339 domain-containing protein [Magnetococcales bacterium]
MESLLVVLVLYAVVMVFIMPWVVLSRSKRLSQEVERLRQTVETLEEQLDAQIAPPSLRKAVVSRESVHSREAEPDPSHTSTLKLPESKEPRSDPSAPVMVSSSLSQTGDIGSEQGKEETKETRTAEPTDKREQQRSAARGPKSKVRVQESFEQRYGARLPVWIGGLALTLAGFFLVKYSIDNNLLTPIIRVLGGAGLGGALLYAAHVIRTRKPDLADGERISQALTGAGVAIFYGVCYAATMVYHFLPIWLGFVGMGVVTASAVVLSLAFGPPIALMGLLGGFLTPALLSSGSGSTPFLFSYLYLVYFGMIHIFRRQQWWGLSMATTLLAMLWAVVWVLNHVDAAEAVWVLLFLLGTSATVVMQMRQSEEPLAEIKGGLVGGKAFTPSIFMRFSLGGNLLLMAVVVRVVAFGILEWGLFGCMAVGGMVLAWFDPRRYAFLPWLSLVATGMMLTVWNPVDDGVFALVLSAFALIHVGGGTLIFRRSHDPKNWALLLALSSLGFYVLAWINLESSTVTMEIPLFWGALAALMAAMGSALVRETMQRMAVDFPDRETVLAILLSTVTAFISLALSIEVHADHLAVAFAFQTLGLAWVGTQLSVSFLRTLTAVSSLLFGLLMLPQFVMLVRLTLYSLFEADLDLGVVVPMVEWPLFHLGLPAVVLMAAAVLLRREKTDRLVHILEGVAPLLITVMGYYLIRQILHPDRNVLFVKAGFLERGIVTNVLFLFGLGCMMAGRRYGRLALSWVGMVLAGVAAFRILYFDLFLYNPIWVLQQVDGWVVLNT